MHIGAFQAVRQSHKKQSQLLAISVNQLSMLGTVIHATAEVRTAMYLKIQDHLDIQTMSTGTQKPMFEGSKCLHHQG